MITSQNIFLQEVWCLEEEEEEMVQMLKLQMMPQDMATEAREVTEAVEQEEPRIVWVLGMN